MKTLLALAATMALLSCCASTPPEESKAGVEDRTPTASTQQGASTVTPVAPKVEQQVNPLKDPNNILSKRSIFYDYDKYDVKDEYKPLLQAHARYLEQNRGAKMLIQGNCDERGSREYNIALGQRRAFAVKRALELLGVAGHRIDAVSFGSEKPIAFGRDEESWRLNRRADIVY